MNHEVQRLKPRTRRQLKLAGAFGLYFLVLWFLWPTPVVYPLKIFVVLLHEVSHGLAAVASGGVIEKIRLSADEGGLTIARGGNAFLMLSAGYLGSLLWGLALIMAAGARNARLKLVLGALGIFVLAMAILFVRGWFGWIFAIMAGAALLIAAQRLRPDLQRVVLTGLGITSALYALLDIQSDILSRPHLRSDARMLAELTGIPTVFWGILWIGIGMAACWFVGRKILDRA
jgi:hypothetical protein